MKMFTKAIVFALLTLGSTSVLADTQTTPVDDATLTQNVQTKIAADKVLSGQKIDVSTNQGVVTLSGNLKTEKQASMAVQNAESVMGVQDVDASKLMVKDSKHPMDDTYITAKVKGAFMREKLFGDREIAAFDIHVDTKNGVVYLTGKADNQNQLSEAIKLAKSINGVKDVDAKVKLKQE